MEPGKTPTSFALMQEYKNHQYITNDANFGANIKVILKEQYTFLDPNSIAKAKELLKEHNNWIFDAGGFTSNVIKTMIEAADILIVPTPLKTEVIVSTRGLILDIFNDKKIKAKKILLINKFKEDKYFEPSMKIVSDIFSKQVDEIVSLRETNILEKLYSEQCSMKEYVERYPRYKNNKIFEEWGEFTKLINI